VPPNAAAEPERELAASSVEQQAGAEPDDEHMASAKPFAAADSPREPSPLAALAPAAAVTGEEAAVRAELAKALAGAAARPVEVEPGHDATAIERAGLAAYSAEGVPGATAARQRREAARAMHEAQGHPKGNLVHPSVDMPEDFADGCGARGAARRAPSLWDVREAPLRELAEGEAAIVDARAFHAEHARHCSRCSATPREACYANTLAREVHEGHAVVFRRNCASGPPLVPRPLDEPAARAGGGTAANSDEFMASYLDDLAAGVIVAPHDALEPSFPIALFLTTPFDYRPTDADAAAFTAARAAERAGERGAVAKAAGVIAARAVDDITAEMQRAGVGDESVQAKWERGLRLRLVPRKNRLIANAKPLNRYVEPWHYRMHDVWRLLDGVERGGWMAKADVKRGFYHLPLARDAWKFFTFYHRGRLHSFRRLPMGLCTSPAFFSWVTAEVNAWLRHSGVVDAHIVYLDDFVVYGSTKARCAEALALLKAVCARVGIELAGDGKTSVEPTQQNVALGIEIDLDAYTVTLPECSLVKMGIYADLALRAARAGEKVPTAVLKSVAGRAVWVSALNPMMRLWTCNMDRLLHAGAGRGSVRHVPPGAVPALAYIVRALRSGKLLGETLCPHSAEAARRTLTITTDAHLSPTAAAIAMRLGDGVQVRVELPDCVGREGRAAEDIAALELLAVVGAVCRWGTALRGCTLICGIDNSAVVDIANSGRSDRADLLELLRELYKVARRFDLRVVCRWLPRWFNYRNDRVASLATHAEVRALDPATIIETEVGGPATALQRIRMMTA